MPNQNPQLPSGGLGSVPYVDEYFGAWAMYEPKFNALREYAQTINVQLHLEQHGGAPKAAGELTAGYGAMYHVAAGGLAVIELRGTMLKHASSFSSGTSTVEARRKIRAAVADAEVAGIMLLVDSPGGTVAGMHDLGRDIAAAAKKKPLHAFAEDLCCSAAYWAASQSLRISAGEGAIVGSIGVFNVVHDLSKAAEKEGVEVKVVKFGAHKGGAVPGTKITEEQLAEYQKLVDAFGDDFVSAVSRGRGLSKTAAEQLADGRVHKGQATIDLKLVNAIESFDEAMQQLAAATTKSRTPAKGKAMSTTDNTAGAGDGPALKTFEQQLAERKAAIAAACPGADDKFVAEQVAAGATPAAAGQAYVKALQERTSAAEAKAAAAEKSAATKTPRRGNEPVKQLAEDGDEGPSGDAGAEFTAKVDDLVAKGMKRDKAVATVAKRHPELRQAWVDQANAGR